MRRFTNCLPILLSALTASALIPGCANSTSSKAQQITCSTDPTTGAVLECVPGAGTGSGGANTCQDIDEDGDGEPHDEGDDEGDDDSKAAGATAAAFAPKDGSDDGDEIDSDSDDDGIDDADDCDEHHGEDHDASSDLPYDIRPQLGATTTPIADAFASKGAAPAAIVSVTMDGGSWRLAELQAGTAFVVTQADCDHVGNRDIGRDRVFVTWNDTVGGVSQTDHLDIRYCK